MTTGGELGVELTVIVRLSWAPGFGEPPPPPDDGEGGGGGDGHGGDNSDSFSWRRLFIMASLFAIAEITVGYLLFAPAWR